VVRRTSLECQCHPMIRSFKSCYILLICDSSFKGLIQFTFSETISLIPILILTSHYHLFPYSILLSHEYFVSTWFIPLDLLSTVRVEYEYKLWSTLLCNFLSFSATYKHFLITLLWNKLYTWIVNSFKIYSLRALQWSLQCTHVKLKHQWSCYI
jgi:hypothetical protein